MCKKCSKKFTNCEECSSSSCTLCFENHYFWSQNNDSTRGNCVPCNLKTQYIAQSATDGSGFLLQLDEINKVILLCLFKQVYAPPALTPFLAVTNATETPLAATNAKRAPSTYGMPPKVRARTPAMLALRQPRQPKESADTQVRNLPSFLDSTNNIWTFRRVLFLQPLHCQLPRVQS